MIKTEPEPNLNLIKELDWLSEFYDLNLKGLIEVKKLQTTVSSKSLKHKILYTVGVHGNEVGPVKAAIEFIKKIRNGDLLLENDIYILFANIEAIKKSERFLDFNLNRIFKETSSSQVFTGREGVRAEEIKTYLDKTKFDLAIDFHSFSSSDSRIIIFNKIGTLRLYKNLINIEDYLYIKEKNGYLFEYLESKKCPSVVVECGQDDLEITSQRAFEIMLNFNKYPNSFKNDIKGTCYSILSAISVDLNFKFLKKDIKGGDFYKKDQVYGFNDLGEVKAPQDCYVLGPTKNIKESDTDAGFLVDKIFLD